MSTNTEKLGGQWRSLLFQRGASHGPCFTRNFIICFPRKRPSQHQTPASADNLHPRQQQPATTRLSSSTPSTTPPPTPPLRTRAYVTAANEARGSGARGSARLCARRPARACRGVAMLLRSASSPSSSSSRCPEVPARGGGAAVPRRATGLRGRPRLAAGGLGGARRVRRGRR